MNRFRFLSAILATLFLIAASSRAQSNEGRILGTIRDSSGAVIRGAKVTVTNTGTKTARQLVTNDAGEYVAPNLEPGSYVVAAEVAGFKIAQSTPVLLEVSTDVRVDLGLQPGSVTQTVEVNEQSTMTDTTDTTLQGVLSNKAINELPVLARDFQNLLPLHPGVQRTAGGGFQSITSNGNRPDENNFFIDGSNGNDAYYGEGVMNEAGIQGTPASILPLDSIQEFNTQESPSADYGLKPGVVMNIGIKSGTNEIHGSAYYFHRNAAFDARNWFAPAPDPVPSLIMHQFGASIGGPIKKDKWFYFVNYEGIRDKVGNPADVDSPVTVSLVPLAGQLPTGSSPADFSIIDALNGCAPACNPLSLKLSTGGSNGTGLFLPNPGFTANQSDPALVDFDFNNTNRGDNLVAKTDYYLNSHNSLNARFIYSNTNLTEEDADPLRAQWLSTASPITQIFGVGWTWTPNSRWVNEARFSYNRFSEAILPVDHNVNPTAYGLNTGITDPRDFGFPRINPGTSNFDYMGGHSNNPLFTTPSQTNVLSDTVSHSIGKHSFRFGGDFSDGTVNYFRASEGRGRIDFDDLEDFVAGDPTRWQLLYGDPGRKINLRSFGVFAQDDYRITPRVTLTLGLRYDITKPIEDSRNQLANYVPTEGIVQVGRGISSPYPTNYNNVSPRLGVAWDIFGTGKTVLRAGGGIIFEEPSIRTFMFNGGGLNLNPTAFPSLPPGNGTINSFLEVSDDPSQLNWNLTGPPIFPSASMATCSIALQCDIFGVNQKLKTPFVANWNVNIQQAITPTAMLQVAYVANKGVNLYSAQDINQVNPALDDGSETIGRPLVTNCPAPIGIGTGGPCFPTIGQLDFLSNLSSSIYNSLQVTLTKRYAHGFYLLAGYTYAHAIDTATNNLAGVPQNSLDYQAERGNSDFDIRHRFTLALTYDIPSVKSKFQMLEGWEVTSILMLEGGQPFTLTDFDDDISGTGEFADRWNMVGPAKDIHWSNTTPIPYFIGPAIPASCFAQATTPALVDSLENFGCFVQGRAVITPPAQGTFGDMGRNIFRGPTFKNLDFSVSKVWKLNERLKFQFRAEFFNILNHPNFDVFTMNNDLGSPFDAGLVNFTPDVAASNPVLGSGGSRHIQLGAKFIW
jgi:hypothetical protein